MTVTPVDNFSPFESPMLLIEGAKTSLVNFESCCNAFIQNCTYDTIRYKDPKSGDKVVKLRFHHRMPPKLRLSAYRILNDLRHALDQAVCDGAISLGRANAKDVYFPIGRTSQDFDREISKKCKNVHPNLIAFIKTCRPYEGGDDLLYALSRLAGPNKHQRIVGMSINHTGLQLELTSNAFIPHADLRPLRPNQWNELRNELEFMRTGPGAQGHIDPVPVLQIVLGDGAPPLSEPAFTSLNTLASKVETIVLGFEAETARILQAD